MSDNGLLGEYLRARRERVRPEDVGLTVMGPRRVAGLRREEVATLAGVSSDYYLRLEQGRDRNPSVQVLESLARVFGLDETATAYLIGLAAPQPRRRPQRPQREAVPVGIRHLVELMDVPAFVESRHFDVLLANDMARAVSPNLRVGQNRMRAMFLDPAEQVLCPSFELAMAHLVAGFRQSIGTDTDDPRVIQLVGELSLSSERFRQLWARHDVQVREGSESAMWHPLVGEMVLHKERLAVGGADGLMLVVYHAVPGTGTDEKLALLAPAATSSADPAKPQDVGADVRRA